MAEEKNKGGRPPISEDDKRLMLSKLEPYLKTGLSVRKSLLEAKIPVSNFYKVMNEDDWFRQQIEAYRQFTSVLLNNAIVGELQSIIKRQNGYTDESGKYHKPEKLNKEDKDFLWKFALTSNLTKGEFGERKDLKIYDPEAEIQKVKGIIAEETTDDIDPLPDGDDE
jgi:hypothetical protein